MKESGSQSKGAVSRRSFLIGAGALAVAGATAGLAGCAGDSQPAGGSSSGGSAESWDREADVVVVGTGPAGVACAATAAEEGASVIAIDANDKIGGKGILAGGNLGIGGGTRMQKEAGFEETADIIYEDRTSPTLRDDLEMEVKDVDGGKHTIGQWRRIAGTEDGAGMARAFADKSLDTWNWLDGLGCPFIKANLSKKSAVYRGSRYYTTTTPMPVNREGAKDDMQAGGAGLIWPMYDDAVENGAEFLLSTKMTKIIRQDGDQAGRAIGIEAEQDGKTIRIKAKKGVFLGTGSWNGSAKLKVLFNPMLAAYPHISGEPYVFNDGSGVELGIAAGAALSTDRGSDWHGWHRHPGTRWHSIKPPYGMPGTAEPEPDACIYVNAEGVRFMDESIPEEGPAWIGGNPPFFFAQLCAAQTADEDGPIVWIVLDEAARVAQDLDFTVDKTVEGDMYATADDLAGLAKGMGVPTDALAKTVEDYNAMVDAGADAAFAKSALAAKIETPPFHAVKWGIQKHNTLGGLTIDPHANVVDWAGEPIPGLYAAGECAGNMDLIGLAKPIVFGRIAGENAAAETAWDAK